MIYSACVALALFRWFERYPEYAKALIEAGFDDCMIDERHIESFAETEEELALHRRMEAEFAQRSFYDECLLSGPDVFGYDRPDPYEGSWLDKLYDETVAELRAKGDMKRADELRLPHLDPCYVRSDAWWIANSRNWRYRSITLVDQRLQRRDEIAALGVVAVPPVEDEPEAVKDFVAACMLTELRDSGWKRIKRGDKKRVILAKRLNGDQELRFELEDLYGLWSFSQFHPRWIGPDKECYFPPNFVDPSLGLHVRSLTGRFSDRAKVKIPFFYLVERPRGVYRNPAHLAVAIGAWIALYRMVAADVEAVCVACRAQCG